MLTPNSIARSGESRLNGRPLLLAILEILAILAALLEVVQRSASPLARNLRISPWAAPRRTR